MTRASVVASAFGSFGRRVPAPSAFAHGLLVACALVAGCDCGTSRDAPTRCESTGECLAIDGPGVAVDEPSGVPAVASFGAPVPDPGAISSTFGPRWKSSAGRYDFHRGIDYFDAIGTPVFAIGDGEVSGVYPEGSTQYPNGGNVLVVEHPLDPPVLFHGLPATRVFAVYLHLDSFAVAVSDVVTAGQTVGAMGMTGDTEFVHLHFETRLETTCSLEYQSSHADASCATGFDPHVHPFLFVGGEDLEALTVVEVPSESGYRVRVTETRGDLDLDVIATDLGTIGFGTRQGIDATTTARLDDLDYGFLELVPLPFSSTDELQIYELAFPRRPAYLELRDIHGHGRRWGTP